MIAFLSVFIYLIIATYQDIKTREISHWLGFSFIGVSFLYRVYVSGIRDSLILFLLIFLLSHVLFSRAWGGGDLKLFIGICLFLGFKWFIYIYLFANFYFFAVALYGKIKYSNSLFFDPFAFYLLLGFISLVVGEWFHVVKI